MAEESDREPTEERAGGREAPRPDEPPRGGWRKHARTWGLRLAVVGILVGLVFAIPWLRYTLGHESTDDAYVEGTIVPISPQVSGQVIRVYVRENQDVTKGEPLFDIDPTDYQARLDQAQATLASKQAAVTAAEAEVDVQARTVAQMQALVGVAKANLDLASLQRDRAGALLRKGAGSQSAYDTADSQWKVDRARLEEARASAAQADSELANARARLAATRLAVKDAESARVLARIDLDRTRVIAPRGGRIAMKQVDRGRYLATGEEVMALVDLGDIWVKANYKETQVDHMQVGQPVDIEVDAYPDRTFHGHVESLQAGSGSVFSLLPPENATGNFVKVVQRIPVRIVVDGARDAAHPLLPGMSVVPYVDIRSRGEPSR